MKRIRALFLCWALLGALTFPVRATDNNPFFNDHAAQCAPNGKLYLLNGEEGYVTVREAPHGDAQSYLCNEQALTVFGVWTDAEGGQWAQLRYTPLPRGGAEDNVDGEKIGWLEMGALLPVSGKQAFIAEHYDEFTEQHLTLTVSGESPVSLWPCPGSGGQPADLRWALEGGKATLDFTRCWVDSLGRRWGAVSHGTADGFLCIDEPSLEENLLPELPLAAHRIPSAAPDSLPRLVTREERGTSPLPGMILSITAAVLCILWILREHHVTKQRER